MTILWNGTSIGHHNIGFWDKDVLKKIDVQMLLKKWPAGQATKTNNTWNSEVQNIKFSSSKWEILKFEVWSLSNFWISHFLVFFKTTFAKNDFQIFALVQFSEFYGVINGILGKVALGLP